jgi:hypothetical protein
MSPLYSQQSEQHGSFTQSGKGTLSKFPYGTLTMQGLQHIGVVP